MKISRAIQIVLELAEANILSEEQAQTHDLTDDRDEQTEAYEIVRNLLGTLPDQDREV